MAEKPKRSRSIRIEEWIEQDLTGGMVEGRFPPAFEVEETVQQVEEILHSGSRSPVIVGMAGVGKTAVIHELLRRAANGQGAPVLASQRVVQISIRSIVSRFKEGEATAFAQRLFDTLLKEPLIVYIRDFHMAFGVDWEPVLYRYLCRSSLPLLGEGNRMEVERMLEYSSELAEYIVPVPLEEPRLDRVRQIVTQWCSRESRPFEPAAQRISIELTSRFLGHLPFPRKALELLGQTRDLLRSEPEELPVTSRDVVRRFSRVCRVPLELVDPEVPLDLAAMRRFVAERLLGQEEAVDAVVRMVALIKAGLSDLKRPFGVFLFVGPTGVGKTHTAQLLAEYLFGDRHRLIRVNMADYSGEEGHTQLFGHPQGHNADVRRGVLTNRLRGHPFGVLLLDEFEKAHAKVHDGFLQLFDEGRFLNGAGETVAVTSLIVIATSNCGAEVYREPGLGFRSAADAQVLDAELDRRLYRTFRFELLNRFDRVVHFHPLDRANIRAIARRELDELIHRDGVLARNLKVDFDAEVLEWLAAHGYHPHYGARFLRRVIERQISGSLADAVVLQQPPPGSRVSVGVRGDRVHVRVFPVAEEKAPVALPGGTVKLDREALLQEAAAWLERWAPLALEHENRREMASQLLTQTHREGFWDRPDEAQALLKRYASVDAMLQTGERLLIPVRRLQNEPQRLPLEELARLVEEGARNYRRWLDLGTGEGPDGLWLLIGPGDALHLFPEFIRSIVGMYQSWAQRKGLELSVVAEEERAGELVRVVLSVTGPGVLALLEQEQGRHRRRGVDGKLERLNVEVLPHREEKRGRGTVEDARHVRGLLIEQRRFRLRVEVPQRGVLWNLLGDRREALQDLGADLSAALAAPAPDLEVAREYGLDGVVRDPRTGAVHLSVKEVFRGDLDVFLRAWENR